MTSSTKGYEINKNGVAICYSCGIELENATFLSETFNWKGGTMVFRCQCGNEIKRTFVPLDLLSAKEYARQLCLFAGLSEDIAEVASLQYKSIQSMKKLKDIVF